jgi:hypothetical protein
MAKKRTGTNNEVVEARAATTVPEFASAAKSFDEAPTRKMRLVTGKSVDKDAPTLPPPPEVEGPERPKRRKSQTMQRVESKPALQRSSGRPSARASQRHSGVRPKSYDDEGPPSAATVDEVIADLSRDPRCDD